MSKRSEGYHQQVIRGPLTVFRALLANVQFAMVQIAAIALVASVGVALKQLPDYALLSASDYTLEMGKLRAIYEPTLGPLTDLFERLGFFRIFTAPWFSALLLLLTVSIVVCTLDRLPKIRAVTARSRVEQPSAFFDASLPGRGEIALTSAIGAQQVDNAAERVAREMRAAGWDAQFVTDPENTSGRIIHGDKFRRSYRFTLVMHTGLVLLLIGAALSGILGYTQGILLTSGEALPVGKIGSESGLVIQNRGFSAPRTETGAFADFATDLAVYRGGVEVAQQIVRVNTPLMYDGWSFHQNFFGPSAALEITSATGDLLWSGESPFTATAEGAPYATLPIPGSSAGIELLLQRDAAGVAAVLVIASEPISEESTGSAGSSELRTLFASVLAPGETASAPGANFSVRLNSLSSYTGIIARRDPAALIVWLAAALIMVGLTLTLRRPRARLWIRIRPSQPHADAALLLERGARAEQAAPLLRRIAATLSAPGDDARTVSA
jgi:cytochrome c biogenesis protein